MNVSMEYWVEVKHVDVCSSCRDGAPCQRRTSRRVRTAQFLYFMEAIDYAQECNRRGVSVWLRKPTYIGTRIKSEYSFYDASAKPMQTPIVLDGKAGCHA
jgi:hypothetical protein